MVEEGKLTSEKAAELIEALKSDDTSDEQIPNGKAKKFVIRVKKSNGEDVNINFPLKFIKASTKSFMYMPLNMSKVMTKTMNDINTAEAVAKDRYMILSKDVSKWSCDHYFLVDSEVPGYPTEDLSGRYFAKVYDGGFKEITSWIKTYQNETLSKGIQTEDMFMFYTTCPKCAAHYGHNYVVILGKVKN